MRINNISSDHVAEVMNQIESDMFEFRIHLTHIVDPRIDTMNSPRDEQSAEQLAESASESGREVIALCGFIWEPDVSFSRIKLPMCQICVQVATLITLSSQNLVRKMDKDKDE